MKKSLLLILALLIVPFFIFADSETEFDLAQCYDAANTNEALKACANEDYALADQKLNQVYAKLTEQIKESITTEALPGTVDLSDAASETLNRLIAAQNAWILYRDTQCNFEGAVMIGDESESIIITGCLSRLTKERAKNLEESIIQPKIESSYF